MDKETLDQFKILQEQMDELNDKLENLHDLLQLISGVQIMLEDTGTEH